MLGAGTAGAAWIPSFSRVGCAIYLQGTALTRPPGGGQTSTLLPFPDLGGPKRGHPALADCSRQPRQQAVDTTG